MSGPLRLTVDKTSPVPLYHQVAQGLEEVIRSGQLPPGTKLDNEIDLANSLNLSRPTMRKAMDQLVRAGLVVRKRGVGTQVIGPQVRRSLELTSLHEDLRSSGGTPSTDVLDFDVVPADEETALLLGLQAGDSVYHLVRLRCADGGPLALMENWIPQPLCRLSRGELVEEGLYSLMRGQGINFQLAHQRVGAVAANPFQAAHLGVAPGAPLVSMHRTAMDDTGRPVETGRHVYRADKYSFELTLVQR
ncbi:GntR family transcriptional regulator [Arthrobacter sp. Sa2CUA1]|uniref:GntR family transcriptional regulator n=1 Tax=Arthrobacter gallicola TaxID=2762225 RepID=A0ABR8UUI1_9MICC|nr:GntR family transcriptional regulator [Arthrobacter gallicola]MBD7996220.1 GntR family transcriptional regulator [Arthrobacter gallicola]